MSRNYWAKRNAKAQETITNRSIAKTEKQLKKYYKATMDSVIDHFTNTYNHLLMTVAEGNAPTPADLYKLDKYWQMQGQMKKALQDLGDKECILLSRDFEKQYIDVYNALALPSGDFSKADIQKAKQVINSIWCADGKTWSNRVWKNTEQLAQTLNDELIKCVVSGKKNRELKEILQNSFGVSYHRANSLVVTEMAHIQTQASKDRYVDSGLTYYEFYAETDSDTCNDCAPLDRERFLLSEMQEGVNAPPMHPFADAVYCLLSESSDSIQLFEFLIIIGGYILCKTKFGKMYYIMKDYMK